MEVFNNFLEVSGLNLINSKCKIAGVGALKGVTLILCNMQCINLNEENVKILGIHFTYSRKLEEEENVNNNIAKTENVLRVWGMRDVTIEGEIVIFKSLAVSKIVHLALTKLYIIQNLNTMKKELYLARKKQK